MNLTEQIAAAKRLQDIWQFFFADLNLPAQPDKRQYLTWLSLYGEKATEQGLQRANIWVNKNPNRRYCLDDVVRYASACARNFKEEAANVETRTAAE
jgi:hypothetical protein